MNNILIQLNNLIENYGDVNYAVFQKKIDGFLFSVSDKLDRRDAYDMIINLSHPNLSQENDDYLSNIVTDIIGHTEKVYYKFKDDPPLEDKLLLIYVRKELWR